MPVMVCESLNSQTRGSTTKWQALLTHGFESEDSMWEIYMISLVGHYIDFELEYLQVPELNWKIYFSFIF